MAQELPMLAHLGGGYHHLDPPIDTPQSGFDMIKAEEVDLYSIAERLWIKESISTGIEIQESWIKSYIITLSQRI